MKPRTLLAAIGLTFVATVATIAVVLVQPWEASEPEPAQAEFGLCNVSLVSVPAEIRVSPFPYPNLFDESPTRTPLKAYLLLEAPQATNVRSITDPKNRSYVGIDASSGEIVDEFYRTPGDRELMDQALSTLEVGPWELIDPTREFELLPGWGC